MGKFLASRAVTDLSYDFNPHVLAKGKIAEPSDKQLVRYQQQTADFAREEMPDVDPNDQRAVLEAVANISEESQLESVQKMAEIVSELCQGSPKVEELMELPPRIRSAFYGWLQEELQGNG